MLSSSVHVCLTWWMYLLYEVVFSMPCVLVRRETCHYEY